MLLTEYELRPSCIHFRYLRDFSKTEGTTKGRKTKHQESDEHLFISLTWVVTFICSPFLVEGCWEQSWFMPKMSVTPNRLFDDWEQHEYINRATQSVNPCWGWRADIKLLWSHFTWAAQNNLPRALISNKNKKQKQQEEKKQTRREGTEGIVGRKLRNYPFRHIKSRKGLEKKKLFETGAWFLWGFKYKTFPCLSSKGDSSNGTVPLLRHYQTEQLFFCRKVLHRLAFRASWQGPFCILWSSLTSEVTVLNILTHELDNRGTGQQENSGFNIQKLLHQEKNNSSQQQQSLGTDKLKSGWAVEAMYIIYIIASASSTYYQ